MKYEFTTSELIRLTGINPRTLTNWTRKGWLPPFRAGGGRGAQNVFDIHGVAWAMTLNEIFRLWPDAATPVYLGGWEDQGEVYAKTWTKTQLSNGAEILVFLRTPYAFARQGTVVLLAQGYDHGTSTRFAQVRIGPVERIKPFVDNWMTTDKALTLLPDDSAKIVTAATLFSYEQNRRKVESAVKRL